MGLMCRVHSAQSLNYRTRYPDGAILDSSSVSILGFWIVWIVVLRLGYVTYSANVRSRPVPVFANSSLVSPLIGCMVSFYGMVSGRSRFRVRRRIWK